MWWRYRRVRRTTPAFQTCESRNTPLSFLHASVPNEHQRARTTPCTTSIWNYFRFGRRERGRRIFREPYALIANCACFAGPTVSPVETLLSSAGVRRYRARENNGDDTPTVGRTTVFGARVGYASGKRTGIEAVERRLEGGRWFFEGVLDGRGWGGEETRALRPKVIYIYIRIIYRTDDAYSRSR